MIKIPWVFHTDDLGCFWKVGQMNRNQEGYMDVTACEAVRRADQSHKKIRRKRNSRPLIYYLWEASGFQEAKQWICG